MLVLNDSRVHSNSPFGCVQNTVPFRKLSNTSCLWLYSVGYPETAKLVLESLHTRRTGYCG